MTILRKGLARNHDWTSLFKTRSIVSFNVLTSNSSIQLLDIYPQTNASQIDFRIRIVVGKSFSINVYCTLLLLRNQEQKFIEPSRSNNSKTVWFIIFVYLSIWLFILLRILKVCYYLKKSHKINWKSHLSYHKIWLYLALRSDELFFYLKKNIPHKALYINILKNRLLCTTN